MNLVVSDLRLVKIDVTNDAIVAQLADGRLISVPLEWSWRLSEATQAQRKRYQIIGAGQGAHWPDVDEDISVRGMLLGAPAQGREFQTKARQGGGKQVR